MAPSHGSDQYLSIKQSILMTIVGYDVQIESVAFTFLRVFYLVHGVAGCL